MSKSKFLGVALATFVAASLTACGGGEEKETRTPSSSDKAAASEMGGDLAVPKSYVREKKADTLPPFIVVVGSNEAGSFFVQQKIAMRLSMAKLQARVARIAVFVRWAE